MSNFSIIIPEDSINYIYNPSFELGTTGWSNYAPGGATGSRSRATGASIHSGIFGYSIAKSSGSGDFGIQWTAPAAVYGDFTSGEKATLSAWITITSGTVQITIDYNDGSAGSASYSSTASERFVVTTSAFAGTLTSLTITIAITSTTGSFVVDGIQLENKSYATSYFDGDQDGCVWIGERHLSRSERYGAKAKGGREYDLQDDLGWTVTAAPGLGMPPIKLDSQQQANIPGEFLNDYRVDARTVQLDSDITGSSLSNLHALRRAIIDLVRPDRGIPPQVFQLKYSGTSTPLLLDIFYDSGLDFGSYSVDQGAFNEDPNIRFFAPDPIWYEEGVVSTNMTSHESRTSTNYCLRYERIDGVGTWGNMGTGFASVGSPVVNAIKRGPDNRIYWAGNFGSVDSVANTRGIAIWNAENQGWESWDGDIDGPSGYGIDICFDGAGNAYVGGSYTAMQAVSNTANLAKWTKSSATWSSVTTSGSADGLVNAVIVDHDGILYAGGQFANINGGAATRIASYDGSSWSALGSGLNGACYALAISPTNELYVGGAFTTANGVTVNGVAKWNGTTFEALEDGVSSGIVYTLMFARDGALYAGGSFADIGSVTTNGIGKWNGQRWVEVGGGFDSGITVFDITENENGEIVACGNFTATGDGTKTFSSPLAIFNGSTWVHADVHIPGSGGSYAIHSILWVDYNRRYIGYLASGTATCASVQTIANTGTAKTYPVIVLSNETTETPTIKWVENQFNRAILYLDHTFLPGEVVTINLTPGKRSIMSSFRGQIWRSLEEASDIENFAFEPGTTNFILFIDGYSSAQTTNYIYWPTKYWSADV